MRAEKKDVLPISVSWGEFDSNQTPMSTIDIYFGCGSHEVISN